MIWMKRLVLDSQMNSTVWHARFLNNLLSFWDTLQKNYHISRSEIWRNNLKLGLDGGDDDDDDLQSIIYTVCTIGNQHGP